jgi:hypothetical protein
MKTSLQSIFSIYISFATCRKFEKSPLEWYALFSDALDFLMSIQFWD